jgi:hypothetical protein
MKKNFIALLVLIHYLPAHASEQQSWWSKNIGLVAGASAAATGIVAGISLWQWKAHCAQENADKKEAEEYSQATKDQSLLQSNLPHFGEALTANDKIREKHMLRKEFNAKDRGEITSHADSLKEHQANLGFRSIDSYLDLYRLKAPLRCVRSNGSECAPCVQGRKEIAKDRLSLPCVKMDEAHEGIRQAITAGKISAEQRLERAQAILKAGEARQTPEAQALAARKAQSLQQSKRQWKAIGYTSAAVSAASLAYLGLRAQK